MTDFAIQDIIKDLRFLLLFYYVIAGDPPRSRCFRDLRVIMGLQTKEECSNSDPGFHTICVRVLYLM